MWREAGGGEWGVGSGSETSVGRRESWIGSRRRTSALHDREVSAAHDAGNTSSQEVAASTPTPHSPQPTPWLTSLLDRNRDTSYLRQYRSPQTIDAFREYVPIVGHDDLAPWIDRIAAGDSDVLFAGRPIAFERTSGSSSAAKLIPYSIEGLRDFQHSVSPWFADVVKTYGITGRVYFSISPATRAPESISGVPVGLPDGSYLGSEGATTLARMTAVPFDVASISDVDLWREETLRHLIAVCDLELISVWSPTFLLRLLDEIAEPQDVWPRLKVVSCWTGGASKPFAEELARRLPQAHLQPKGLLSTECVVTIPDGSDKAVLTPHGFFEFAREERIYLAHELEIGDVYEVIATTASGLYRYRTGDRVRCEGFVLDGRPVLEFVGRGELVSDLVGEKLTESFVATCVEDFAGFRLLVPEATTNGYVLLAEAGVAIDIDEIERRLHANPQYAYARRIGQLQPLRFAPVSQLFDRFVRDQVGRGARLGDVKPAVLRNERDWLDRLGCLQ